MHSSTRYCGGRLTTRPPDAGSERWAQVRGGVLAPLGLPVIDTANFLGYVLWSVWSIAFAVVIDTANFLGYVLWSVWSIAFAVVILGRERGATPRSVSNGLGRVMS